MKTNRLDYDLAYGSFLFCGLAASFGSVIGPILDASAAAFIGMWLVFGLFVAGIIQIVFCIRLWNHWPLGVLFGMNILVGAEVYAEYGSHAFYTAVPIVYSVGVLALCGRWFLVLRGRYFPAGLKE